MNQPNTQRALAAAGKFASERHTFQDRKALPKSWQQDFTPADQLLMRKRLNELGVESMKSGWETV